MYDGTIYTRQSVPAPLLSITASNDNLVLAWLVPSMPFVLQSSPDLSAANWTDVQATPALNCRTLQYEVLIPKPPAPRFYRLESR